MDNQIVPAQADITEPTERAVDGATERSGLGLGSPCRDADGLLPTPVLTCLGDFEGRWFESGQVDLTGQLSNLSAPLKELLAA